MTENKTAESKPALNFLAFAPVNHYVHVEVVDVNQFSSGKIILPPSAEGKLGIYKVIAAGPGYFDAPSKTRLPMACKPGDYVLVVPTNVLKLSYTGQAICVIEDQHVLGILTYNGAEGNIGGDTPKLIPSEAREASRSNPGQIFTDTDGERWMDGSRIDH